VANFFLGQSIGIDVNNTFQLQFIGIDENITFQLKFICGIKTVGATVLGGLWKLEWAWHSAETNLRVEWAWHSTETNLRFVRSSGICMPNLNSPGVGVALY